MDVKDNKVETYAVENGVDQHRMNELDPTGVLVKPKWRGTSHDRMEMETLGRNQVLRVRRQSRARLCSVPKSMLKIPCREIFDFCPCSDLGAHSSVPGRFCWRDFCNQVFVLRCV